MIDPQLKVFLSRWDQDWSTLPAGSGPAQRRAHFESIAAARRLPLPAGVTTAEHWLPSEDASRTVRVREFRPVGSGPFPTLIYLHGGAMMVGSPETHWDITADFAALGLLVLSVDYALVPEHPFPAAVNDCRAVVRWVFDQASALGVRAGDVAVGGDSAGANLSAAMTLVFRDQPQKLRAQLLVYPGLDYRHDRDSHRENPDGPIVVVAHMAAVDALYCPDPKDLLNPLAAPLLAADHRGLPPAFIAVAQHDPLRDSGLAYVDALAAAGVPVELDRGPGLIHSYLRARADCAAAQAAFERMGRWLVHALA
jgi:acetyl esterase